MIIEEFCSVEFICMCTRAVNWQAQADKYSKFSVKWLSVGWETASLDQRRELGKYLASTQAFSRVLDHVLTRSMNMEASSTSSFHQTGKLMPSLSHRIQISLPPTLSPFSSSRTKHAPNTRKHTEEEDTNAKSKAHESWGALVRQNLLK